MLFLVSSSGVPSVASFVKLADSANAPPPPTIGSFSPTSGEVGSMVTISGDHLTGASSVTFNNVVATQFPVVSDEQISVAVPPNASDGRIRVTTAGGTATSATDFDVVAAPPPPPPPGSAYRDAVLADNPIGYWRLSETGSTTAVDVTGNAPNGRYRGGATQGVPGALASDSDLAARFDAVDDYVSVPHYNLLNVGDVFSLELWAKRTATQSVTQRLLHKGTGPAALGFGGNNRVVLLPGGTGATATASSDITITDQAWHHIVATKNGSQTRVYIDGVDRTLAGTAATMTASTTALNIARASTSSAYFAGDVDEVAVYPTALSAARVEAHYQAAGG